MQNNLIFPYPGKDSQAAGIALSWLLRLRWGAVVCQILVFAVVILVYKIAVPVPILLAVIVFQAGSNLVFIILQRRGCSLGYRGFGPVLALDIILLTLLLYFSGGPMNPFTFLYLVHVVLGAMLMRSAWAWGLAFLASGCYALIFMIPRPPELDSLGREVASQAVCGLPVDMNLHLQGMWVAYTMTACFVVFFVNRIQRALADHQLALNHLEEERARSERLAALATLAAGAAHEFSSPLSTIAVAAGEMIHTLDGRDDSELLDDAELIRGEVRRCKEIIGQLNADAGNHLGETLQEISLGSLLAGITREFFEWTGKKVRFACADSGLLLRVPTRIFTRTLGGLLKNGLDAGEEELEFKALVSGNYLVFMVNDRGVGMTAEVMNRAGEPFFTTKEPGRGMGLGLYLARSLAERFGGDLRFESNPGGGTTVFFRVKLALIRA